MTTAIRLDDVVVRLGGVTVLDGVNLEIGERSWTTIVGPNGAGKTTLLRAVLGLVAAAGQVTVGGNDLATLDRRGRATRMALVPQDPVVPLGMSVAHYILLGRTARLPVLARESAVDLDAVERALEHLDLVAFAGRPIETLSGGERQRAVLARALAQEAPILLLDEPTSALDIGHQVEVLDLVDRLRHDLGLTVVAAMHDLTMAARHSDDVILLREGTVIATGPPAAVLTATNLRRHYQTDVDIIDHHGQLVVVPSPKETPDA